jgi:uncharacterized protein (DUF2267 family)
VEAKEFFATVAERAALSKEEAADLTRATLKVLADRLSGGETRDLALYLPEALRNELQSGSPAAVKFGLDDLVDRVKERTGLNGEETTRGVRAFFLTLREAVPQEEYDQAMSQLPGEFRELVNSPG